VTSPAELRSADLVILPGSKSTIADLVWLRNHGLADAIALAPQRGTPVIGLCGGYQMLGTRLEDPDRIESAVATAAGLGLLPVVTTFAGAKRTVSVRGRIIANTGPLAGARGREITGYEIHIGRTRRANGEAPIAITERGGVPCNETDGAHGTDGMVIGTYLHGIFANSPLRAALLGWLASRKGRAPDARWGSSESAAARYDRLADAVAAAIDVKAVAALAGL